jgi:AraC-like DNA-binding protein
MRSHGVHDSIRIITVKKTPSVGKKRSTLYQLHAEDSADLRQRDSPWSRRGPDSLGDFFEEVRLSTTSSGVARFSQPFGMTIRRKGLHIFAVTHGQTHVRFLEGSDVTPLPVKAGDGVLVRTGEVVVMTGALPFRVEYPLNASPAMDVLPTYVEGDSMPGVRDIEVLAMECQEGGPHPTLLNDLYPAMIHITRETPRLDEWLNPLIELFRGEHRRHSPTRSVLSRVAEILCVQALRCWAARLPRVTKGWQQGLQDERIAAALKAIHRNPGARWTVESLAHESGMSRTSFATKFRDMVGESPMEYVSRWRMHRAARLLDQGVSLKSVIEITGFKSAAAFRSRFKERFGVLPRAYRAVADSDT